MAKPIVTIQFPAPASPDFMSRALDYMEDVYRALLKTGIASIDDIDSYASGRFVVRVASTRHLGEVMSLVKKLLARYDLEDQAVVGRGDRASSGDV